MTTRQYPQSVDAEKALLGGLMRDPSRLSEIGVALRPEHFYRAEHGHLFRLLLEMDGRQAAIDVVTVIERVARDRDGEPYGGVAYVMSLPDQAPSTANLAHYGRLVVEKAQLRGFLGETEKIVEEVLGGGQDIDELREKASKAAMNLTSRDSLESWYDVSQIVDAVVLAVGERSKHAGESLVGVTTGFADLDVLLAGLHASDLVILAARPAMGKTALALNMARNAAGTGARVGLFSMEMSRGQLVSRLLCAEALVESDHVRTGRLSEDEWERLAVAERCLRVLPFHILDMGGMSLAEVRSRARELKSRHVDLRLIMIDYLQLMRGDDARAPREQQISTISRGLKALAKELDITVVALSQLNRGVESRQDKRPLLSDLRESGAIEQDADVILFIYRDDYYNKDSADKGLAEIIVAKQRQGATDKIKLVFQGQYTRFFGHVRDDERI